MGHNPSRGWFPNHWWDEFAIDGFDSSCVEAYSKGFGPQQHIEVEPWGF